jgi:mono/diheme cytochrome c family protein
MSSFIDRPVVRWSLALLPLLALGAAPGLAADAAFSPKPTLGSVAGSDTYNHICQGCHMPEGQGAVGAGHYPKLAGDPALLSWQFVATTVLDGRNGMPPFGVPVNGQMEIFSAYLTDQEVADVVNYVRGHFGNKSKEKVTAGQIAGLPHPGAAR